MEAVVIAFFETYLLRRLHLPQRPHINAIAMRLVIEFILYLSCRLAGTTLLTSLTHTCIAEVIVRE